MSCGKSLADQSNCHPENPANSGPADASITHESPGNTDQTRQTIDQAVSALHERILTVSSSFQAAKRELESLKSRGDALQGKFNDIIKLWDEQCETYNALTESSRTIASGVKAITDDLVEDFIPLLGQDGVTEEEKKREIETYLKQLNKRHGEAQATLESFQRLVKGVQDVASSIEGVHEVADPETKKLKAQIDGLTAFLDSVIAKIREHVSPIWFCPTTIMGAAMGFITFIEGIYQFLTWIWMVEDSDIDLVKRFSSRAFALLQWFKIPQELVFYYKHLRTDDLPVECRQQPSLENLTGHELVCAVKRLLKEKNKEWELVSNEKKAAIDARWKLEAVAKTVETVVQGLGLFVKVWANIAHELVQLNEKFDLTSQSEGKFLRKRLETFSSMCTILGSALKSYATNVTGNA